MGTDMVYLTKGGFWLTFGQVVSTASSFLVSIAFANLLLPETYGTYQLVLATAGVLSATTLSGLNTAAIRSVARGADGVVSSSLRTKLYWGTLGSLGAIVVAAYYYFNDNHTLSFAFLIVSLFLPFFYSLGIAGTLLKGKRLFEEDAKYGMVIQIAAAAVLVATMFVSTNLFVILSVYFGTWTLLRFGLYKFIVKKFKTNDNNDQEIESYGKHLSVMEFIGTISDNIDKILIFHYVGAAEVAIYSLAVAPVMQLKGLLKNVHMLALPKLSLRTKEELQNSIMGRTLQITLFSLPLAIVYVLAAPYIYKIFFPAYLSSIIYSQVFAISIVLAAMGTLTATSLQAQLEVRKKYILTFFSKVTKVILMIALISTYGIWGIIWAVLVNYLLVGILSIWLVKSR